MNILSLDSSTESATCSVISEDKLYGEITFNYKKQHSKVLMPMVDELLKNINMDINSIDGFVVSKGPGSFTGLRIGAALIKGLSQGTGKPFVGVSSLDALAYGLSYTSGVICPIIDALRGNVYTALYRFEKSTLIKTSDYMIISVKELVDKLNKTGDRVCFVGDALKKHKNYISENIQTEHIFAPISLNIVKASSLGELGIKLMKNNIYDDIYNFAPFYLRKSQAEREYEKKVKLTGDE
ncbi:tRNA (adenosine(37)-N6)-threonylcarbamoyltransferase complex dimerization subunit type 1 TsaB [Clostridium sp.]|jgi:tRNA threonylcarbamoyladenosine biosynthesis protein TsaB|uniref:tRNA (adenosine(37)-N6)-threonylcarbamoyltransferase complex dimerization subunit type 1 TsaB n=1 Tax=Clostridium sp. TaxID=1506 RepID=UPI003A5B9C70